MLPSFSSEGNAQAGFTFAAKPTLQIIVIRTKLWNNIGEAAWFGLVKSGLHGSQLRQERCAGLPIQHLCYLQDGREQEQDYHKGRITV
ncbi:hypothetical protein E2C01_099442 [Portunus trituberculatus]|uniref:Uncharacterized protein n=1 Tax=Portunus trituberculatus TaxID=210409 RepID=A0A5B7KFE6_PORTR|nr:hypothetical protein [Portunus trituberculatus]